MLGMARDLDSQQGICGRNLRWIRVAVALLVWWGHKKAVIFSCESATQER